MGTTRSPDSNSRASNTFMPQTLTPEWFEMLGMDASEVHAEWLHTVGNLTITGYNPELSNRPYQEKRTLFALSHFELNRYFGDHERWGANEVQFRAQSMFKTAIQLWPRPEIVIVEVPSGTPDKGAPAAFHADCVKLAQQHLGVHLSKLSQTRYESGDGSIRLFCAVSTAHDESRELPYFSGSASTRPKWSFSMFLNHPTLCLGVLLSGNYALGSTGIGFGHFELSQRLPRPMTGNIGI